jgi:hypothetical protein
MRVIDYEDRLIPEKVSETYIIHDTETGGASVKSITAKKALIGKMTSPNNELLGNDDNAVLLQMSDDTFVYIGEFIYKFSLEPEDVVDNSVRNYYSYVSRNNSPIPVFACSKNIYFLHNNSCLARDILPPNLSTMEDETLCEILLRVLYPRR